jgi:hypothetical protein
MSSEGGFCISGGEYRPTTSVDGRLLLSALSGKIVEIGAELRDQQ